MFQDLIDHGEYLLMSLVDLLESKRLHHCPILIVAHSLGGFIVKEAIRRAYRQTERAFRSFLKTLAGTILMGTPHSISLKHPKWENAALLPNIDAMGFRSVSMQQDDIQRLTRCSMDFDQATGLRILTLCEKKETKVRHRLASKKIMLVDKEFARTGSIDEEIIEIDSNHKNLCLVSENKDVLNFIDTVLGDARLRILKGSPVSDSEAEEWSDIGRGYCLFDDGESISNPTSGPERNTASATAGTSDLGYEIVPMPSPGYNPREVPNLPCHMIPITRNKDFYGRESILDEVDKHFFPSGISGHENSNNAKSFALCGPGGMGKTQIAAEYAHRCRESHKFDAIFWVYADEQSKISDGIGQIAINLKLIAEDSLDAMDPVITANQTKGWLANPVKNEDTNDEEADSQASWLIIFDNVDDLSVFDGFWPFDGPGCILITSRDTLAKDPAVLAKGGIDLGPFSAEEASTMIEKLTNRKDEDSRGVVERLGGLPLAISQMASVIIRNHLTFKEFNQVWDEKETHEDLLNADGSKVNANTYEKNLSTVWAIENLRHGKALLDVMAFLDPDIMQEYVLKAQSSSTLKHYPITASEFIRARTELLQTSLVSKDNTAQKLIVHRLVQDAARSKMEPAYYLSAFSAALELVCVSWPFEAFGWRHGVARWRRCEELFPHVLRLKSFGASLSVSTDTIDMNIKLCKLMNDAGWYYHETGHSLDAQPLIETAQMKAVSVMNSLPNLNLSLANADDICKQLNAIIAETHHNLGCIGTETNQPGLTLIHFKKFNEMMAQEVNETLQKTDNRLAISWNELGNAYMLNKMYLDGERCFKECLSVARQMSQFDPSEFSFPYVNLGLAFWLTGRLEQATETLLEGLQYRETRYGRDDQQSFITGRFLYALGNVTTSQGRLDVSFSYHQRALRQFHSTIGKTHHRTGDVHVRIARHYLRLEMLNEAKTHIDDALRIFGDRAAFRPEKARATFTKSEISLAEKDIERAERLRKESIQAYFELTGQAAVSGSDPVSTDFDELVAFWSR
ncbi:hypothetical protein GQ43DRAFT_269423 [Delitschia confertaspora ATCC 74209]|uniref:NB-ARC domain-containing protein n=1 Tax=Delitschia confertaspora ATCC 74209 TaxID=1513339 RepID=A0A9P4JV03_9PLEO|nr:hypothetical protein GQ43DRAFT_269423 [Delitschia confertaspora ATCC 74209]